MSTHKVSYVTSSGNPLVTRLRRQARHGSGYRKEGEVVLEGEHLCLAWAARGARALQALVAESAWQDGRHAELASTAADATVILSDPLMQAISTLETPPTIAFVVALPAPSPVDADAASVVLDRLQDAGNVGSILRSAAAFGYRQVLALAGSAALWSPKVLRAAMGAHFALVLHEQVAVDALDGLLRVPLHGTSPHAAATLGGEPLAFPCAWAFGNEGAGLSEAVALRCARFVRIEQPGGEESLNVAAAAAICLHAGVARRAAAGGT